MAVALLLALEGAALGWAASEPIPGPLLPCTRVAVVHLALLLPAVGALSLLWCAYAAAIAVSIVVMSGYGHAPNQIAGCVALVLSAAAAGAATGRFSDRRLPMALMTLLLALPYACAYLVEEFGVASAAAGWRELSPLAGAAPGALLLLWAWPVAALARRRRT